MRKKYDPREFQRQLERRNEASRLAAAEFAKAAEKAAEAPDGGAVVATADAAEKPRHDPDPDLDCDLVVCLLEEAVGFACLWLALQSQPARLGIFLSACSSSMVRPAFAGSRQAEIDEVEASTKQM